MYGYIELTEELSKLNFGSSFLICSLGKSAMERSIYGIKVGKGRIRGLIFGAVHAREYLTAKLVLLLAKDYHFRCKSAELPSLLFVPMVNPDGVELVLRGRNSILKDNPFLSSLPINYDFSLWKANANGVDLNVNFDAYWGQGEKNVKYAHSENYIGKFPLSEKENLAIVRAVNNNGIKSAVAYHTKGEVIYHGFHSPDGKINIDQYAFALPFSLATGYPLQSSKGSCGGFKDWFILTKGGSCVTIETGNDKLTHPLGLSVIDAVYEQNKEIAILLAESIL